MPSGISMSMFFRLCFAAFRSLQHLRTRRPALFRNRNFQFARSDIFRSATRCSSSSPSSVPDKQVVRRFRPRPDQDRECDRRLSSFPRRVRRPGRCFRCREAASESRSAAGHRADAVRSTARREHTARRQATNPAMSPAECAALRRPTSVDDSRSSVRYCKPDIIQEPQPRLNLQQDAFGDLRLRRTQRQMREEIVRSAESSSGKRPRCSCR